MKRVGIACLIGFFAILTTVVALAALEYRRVSNLCRGASSRVASAQEAMSAIRNYRGPFPFPNFLPRLREFEAFQHDGFGTNGGWSIEEWTRLWMHGYTVDFSLNDPQVSIICEVYECGAVDIHNCLTLGPFYK